MTTRKELRAIIAPATDGGITTVGYSIPAHNGTPIRLKRKAQKKFLEKRSKSRN